MSDHAAHSPDHAGHGAHGAHNPHAHDDGMPHGTRKGYLIGFALSVVLTVIPFALIMSGGVARDLAIGIAMACALVQIVVHMVYFLHMNSKAEGGWTIMALIFTIIVVVIAMVGSIWVMSHMNSYMMPDMDRMNMSGGM